LLGASWEVGGGEMGEAAEASKNLHNWMGETGQGGRDDEEKTLQLSLGLPGGGGGAAAAWRAPGRDTGSHSAAGSSMLSLGYSNAAALSPCCSQGTLCHLALDRPQHHGSILSRQQQFSIRVRLDVFLGLVGWLHCAMSYHSASPFLK